MSAGLLAIVPDLDLADRRLLHIRDPNILMHRGMFHSPFFIIVLAGVLALMIVRGDSRMTFVSLWALWAGCILTHPLLDALTDGGRGVMLLIPFARTRMYLPWRPIHTPPQTVHLLVRALTIRSSEIPFCAAAIPLAFRDGCGGGST